MVLGPGTLPKSRRTPWSLTTYLSAQTRGNQRLRMLPCHLLIMIVIMTMIISIVIVTIVILIILIVFSIIIKITVVVYDTSLVTITSSNFTTSPAKTHCICILQAYHCASLDVYRHVCRRCCCQALLLDIFLPQLKPTSLIKKDITFGALFAELVAMTLQESTRIQGLPQGFQCQNLNTIQDMDVIYVSTYSSMKTLLCKRESLKNLLKVVFHHNLEFFIASECTEEQCRSLRHAFAGL